MVDIVKVKSDGVQVYPQTHANAVVGLSSIVGPKGDKGDQGIKGETGPVGAKGATGPQGPAGQNATTTAVATTTINGLMAAADKKKLDEIKTITFEKVGVV